jgi:predicted DsbA family dithiol-disulfide isomerase
VTRLDIISDPVCPWCYLGTGNLFHALAARQAHRFAIRWRPFQLNPDMPAEGMDRAAYVATKFGDARALDDAHARIAAMGAEVGLAFAFDRIRRSPNTLDAHRVIHWAAAEGVQTRVAMGLFARYFERGEDIGDHAALADAAGEAGMDRAVAAKLLAGDADREGVRAEVAEVQAMGVTGVPTFLIGGRYVVTGAQPVAFWTRVADELAAAATGA